MNLRALSHSFTAMCDWLMKLAYLNGLWLLFTACGVLVFGWAPATAALHSVLRKLRDPTKEVAIFREFAHVYKQNFFKATGIGTMFVLGIGALLVSYVGLVTMAAPLLMRFMFLSVACFYVIMSVFLFPVLISSRCRTFSVFKLSFLYGVGHLHYAVIGIVFVFGFFFLSLTIPTVGIFFGVSLPAWFVCQLFVKMEEGQKVQVGGVRKVA
ncbi:YesL family protein [Halalkalibacterium halodurans]|nr:YesL family protein [Halalkalibacterium halodurans]MED3645500.1 YesL family protein [Halalkalibacterium halodurans]TES57945.1 DUF624 domain-containing protein [Halalkalibacterium halodurans]TPE70771.1 DUF624 domain-containing protein [Halalkalibacterium halodurans]